MEIMLRLAFAFKIGALSKKSATEVSVMKAKVILVTLASTQSSSEGKITCLGEPDRSTTPPQSFPLTISSTGCTV